MAVTLTLSELAKWVGGEIVRGEPSMVLKGLAALDAAGPGDVSFLGNDKYHGQFEQTRASAVLVEKGEVGGPKEVGLIAVENPTLSFGAVVNHFMAVSKQVKRGVHERAFVDESVELDPSLVTVHAGAVIMAGSKVGKGTEIGPNVTIYPDVVIGEDCEIMANVTIRERCVVGNRVVLQPGCVIGADGFGFQLVDGKHVKIDQVGIVELGDDVEVGANTTIDRARFGKTQIGEGTKIDNLVQIGHNCVVGKHSLIVALAGISGSTQIGDYCTIAGQVGTVGHVKVSDHVILAARAGVTCDIKNPGVYHGSPAAPISESMKLQAQVRRLPKLVDRVKALEELLSQKG